MRISVAAFLVLSFLVTAEAKQTEVCKRGLKGATDTEKFVEVGRGYRMYARFQAHAGASQKPAIVILHGTAANSQSYEGLARELYSAGHDILRIDLPGHGKSLQESGILKAGFAEQGEFVTFIMREFDVRHAVIYGHSFGAGGALMSAIRFKKDGGQVEAVVLDEPYVRPIEEYYYENQDEMISRKISSGVKTVGVFGMLGGALAMCTPLAFTGIPQTLMVAGVGAAAWGKAADVATAICSELAVPIIQSNGDRIVAYKIEHNPGLYLVDGELPATPDRMAEGAVAAYDPVDLRKVAPELGDTPAYILLGIPNAMMPIRLIKDYERRFNNGQIVNLEVYDLGDSRPHLHPQDAPEAVAKTITSLLGLVPDQIQR